MTNKNVEMLKCFWKIMQGQDFSLVIPKMYAKDIYSIDYDFLKKRKKTNLIFDIDNTILPVNDITVPEELKKFFKRLESHGFNICILSNNSKERVIPVARELETGYLFKADKPHKKAFTRALVTLDAVKENTAMIGDQMLTDVKGANEYGIYSILVEPVSDRYDIKTGTSRILQNIMVKKLTKNKVFRRYDYYTRSD